MNIAHSKWRKKEARPGTEREQELRDALRVAQRLLRDIEWSKLFHHCSSCGKMQDAPPVDGHRKGCHWVRTMKEVDKTLSKV